MRAQISVENRRRVEMATVRLTDEGGRGVLVPGEFIVTATHCVDWSGEGGMVLGDEHPTEIETACCPFDMFRRAKCK